jgi:thiol-disulfide isomerase/thioredoxin
MIKSVHITKRIVQLVILCFVFTNLKAQQGYDIRMNFKNCPDSELFLLKYVFDQTYIVDTCKHVKQGRVEFKGKTDLDKGVYILVSQEKAPYFEFLVNESQKFTINTDATDIVSNLVSPDSKENNLLFTYMKHGITKNKEFNATLKETKGKSKEDSARMVSEKVKQLNADVKKYEADFMQSIKGTFLYDLMNLRTEKVATEIPKAKNGRPDSLYPYYYYKSHYFEGVNFKDDRIARTPYFDDRVKKYFDNVVVTNPDTAIAEIDKLLSWCTEGNLIYRALVGYFSYKYEQTKIIGFDKVFVHVADKYVLTGKVSGLYSESTIKSIRERVDIMRNLITGKKVPDLYMLDTLDTKRAKKMGFDTVTSAQSITNLYYQHEKELAPLFKTLYNINAKYTVLVFWAADCSHCKEEVPKLHENLKELKGKVDVKVFAVQTKDDLFDDWRKFIISNKLTDFIHVTDPVHINGFKDKFDVNSTPVIYVLDRDKKIIARKLATELVVNLIKHQEMLEKKP